MKPLREVAATAALIGLITGWGEGALLAWSRGYPKLLAPYKVSLDILWVAPIVDLLLFTGGGVLLALGLRWLPGRIANLSWRIWTLLLVAAMFGTWTTALGVLHPMAATVLALGAGLFAAQRAVGPKSEGTESSAAPIAAPWSLPRRVATATLLLAPLLVGGWRLATSGLIGGPFLGAVEPQRKPDVTRPMDVFVITLDTVRADRLAGSGANSLTPRVDALAERGVRFDNAWSTTSWSLPSQASILTGLLPHEHGADWPDLRLDPARPTLAESLATKRYTTGCFSSNAAWIVPEHLGRGFETFEVYQLEDLLRRTVWGRQIDRQLWRFGFHYSGRGKPAARLNQQFFGWVDRHPRQRLFAYLCYMDVNRTFHAARFNAGWFRRGTRDEVLAAYDRGLQELDTRLGELFDGLAARGRLDDALIVITSDHGESFGAGAGDDHDPSGHGTSLYGEQLRVPLIVVPPRRIEKMFTPGSRVARTVSVQDIPRSVLTLLGGRSNPFGGTALIVSDQSGEAFPLLDNANQPDDATTPLAHAASTLNYAGHDLDSLATDDWHLIRNNGEPNESKAVQLFDLERDRPERDDQSKSLEHRAALEELRQLLDRRLSTAPAGASERRQP